MLEDDRRHDTLLIAGIPRSGTTLACAVLNRLPSALALAEPMNVEAFSPMQPVRWADQIRTFAQQVRVQIATTACYPTKASADEANFFPASASGLRPDQGRRQLVPLTRVLQADFRLFIKHPNAFMAMLPHLVEEFPLVAMIRNPLAVLGSWQSIAAGFRLGRAPAAERLDTSQPSLSHRLSAKEGVERTLCLLNWYYEICTRHLKRHQILRYEELVASGGAALAPWLNEAAALQEPLQDRNASPIYRRDDLHAMAEALLASDGACWDYYSKAEVEDLLKKITLSAS